MAVANDAIRDALARGGLIDITTRGRRTGTSRRIEIVFHNISGRIYISGIPSPRRRDWLANLEAQPRFTFHLKGRVKADLAATARIITDGSERRDVLSQVARNWGSRANLDRMIRYSPLIEISFDQ